MPHTVHTKWGWCNILQKGQLGIPVFNPAGSYVAALLVPRRPIHSLQLPAGRHTHGGRRAIDKDPFMEEPVRARSIRPDPTDIHPALDGGTINFDGGVVVVDDMT